MDQQLRERILRSLRWLVTDIQWRANQTKEGDSVGYTHEYSPELKEAMNLLTDLEQGQLLTDNPMEIIPTHTEQDCYEVGAVLGMTKRVSLEFFLQYHPQWVRGIAKKPMTDLRNEMRRWQLTNQCEDMKEPVRNRQGKTPRQLDIEKSERER